MEGPATRFNRNTGCIETWVSLFLRCSDHRFNRNTGCIETSLVADYAGVIPHLTVTQGVLKRAMCR